MYWETKNLCDWLYCSICCIAVIWNWTYSISEVCLFSLILETFCCFTSRISRSVILPITPPFQSLWCFILISLTSFALISLRISSSNLGGSRPALPASILLVLLVTVGMDHHPAFEVGMTHCLISFSTIRAQGLFLLTEL